MSTVYLHMGMPKTGTTALQSFLWDNNEVLQKFNICYPHSQYRYPRVKHYRNGHFLIAPFVDENGRTDSARPCQEYQEGLNMLADVGKQYDKIILSDEALWRASWERPGYWEELKTEFGKRNLQLEIIVYLRRQDLWIQGYWAQKIKEGSTATFSDYFHDLKKKTYLFDYYAYMNHLSKILGKEALHIRIYEKAQFQGEEKTLHSDFLSIFGLSLSDGFVMIQEVWNTRLDGSYLALKQILNTVTDYEISGRIYVDNISLVQSREPFSARKKYTYFHPQEQKNFLKMYAESNQKLAQEYLGRPDGILFYEKAEDLPEFSVSDHELLMTSICVYGRMFEYLIRENQKLKQIIANDSMEISEAETAARTFNLFGASEEDLCKLERKTNISIGNLKRELTDLREDVVLYRLKRKAKKLLRTNTSRCKK